MSSDHSLRTRVTKLVREKLVSSLPGNIAWRTVMEEVAATSVVDARDSPSMMGARVKVSTAEIAVEMKSPRTGPAPTLPPKRVWSRTDPVNSAAEDATPLVIAN